VRYFDHRFPSMRRAHAAKPGAVKDPLALHQLLEQQHYRLAYWRVASDEINYRRFFEITDLAGMRVEDRTVFERRTGSSALAKRADRRPAHRPPDGLADPRVPRA